MSASQSLNHAMQVQEGEAMHATTQAEMEDLRAQLQELQAAVVQAVEEIEARNDAAVQAQATADRLAPQLAAREEEIAQLRSGAEALGVRAKHLRDHTIWIWVLMGRYGRGASVTLSAADHKFLLWSC